MGDLAVNLSAPPPETLESAAIAATADVPTALNGLTHSGTGSGNGTDWDYSVCGGEEEEESRIVLGNSNSDQDAEEEEINRFCLISEDVVEQILLRLDAECLRVCKCVCKHWFHLINDPSFVNKHLLRNCNAKGFTYLKWFRPEMPLPVEFYNCWRGPVEYNSSEPILSLVTIYEGNGNNNNEDFHCVIEPMNILPKLEDLTSGTVATGTCPPFRKYHLVATHCNGIIHMFGQFENLSSVLFNPALREYKLLRGPALPFSSNLESCVGCGFGYDPKSNTYKYVKIFVYKDYRDPVAMVHTLGTNSSSWRKIEFDVEKNSCSITNEIPGIYCKGAYYWHCFTKNGLGILSFDMSNESFRTIPIPHDVQRNSEKEKYITRLGVWNESFALFCSTGPKRNSTCYQLWVMVDSVGGVDEDSATRWIKRLKFGPLPRSLQPINFWKDDELLLDNFQVREGELLSYNIYNKQLRRVPFPGKVAYYCYVTPCFKSIVSV
ncbi:uncharacterized protein LOC133804235 [Humulus lupulus]|uniref:uncharacterized protein LOC133804235 n=1 Tax=Humulus lupulus TaxID=3486 RepID=UPI002B40C726|nr:uncharacterized protein LOC133804235 [Humulus lupulus]